MPNSSQTATPRSLHLALALAGLLWVFAARSVAAHLALAAAIRFDLPLFRPPLEQALLVALLLLGFAALARIGRLGSLRTANQLPRRSTRREEFGRGAILGWAMVLFVLAPLVLLRALSPTFLVSWPEAQRALLSLLSLALLSLAAELAFRGFIYQRLIAATGVVSATFLLALLYAFVGASVSSATAFTFVTIFLFGVVYSIAWQRTHALWLGWGLHFAWIGALAVLFGLPVGGSGTYATLVQTSTWGWSILAGGQYGPEGSLLAALAGLLAIPILYALTRDFAWEYTHPAIVSAGYAVDVAPPAAHTAMEAAAPAPAPLVQIAAITPAAPSTMPEANELLRRSQQMQPPDPVN